MHFPLRVTSEVLNCGECAIGNNPIFPEGLFAIHLTLGPNSRAVLCQLNCERFAAKGACLRRT